MDRLLSFSFVVFLVILQNISAQSKNVAPKAAAPIADAPIAPLARDGNPSHPSYARSSVVPIDVAAVGRVATLGELYDARSDQFISLQLFNDSLPEDTISQRENWQTKLQYSNVNSLEDKFNVMDISASLKISVMGGLFNLEGSGKFFKDTKKSARSAKATLIQTVSTKAEKINFILTKIRHLVDLDVLTNVDCTHVVVGIQWGGNVFISVEDTNRENEDVQVIEGSLSATLKKLAFEISGEAKVNVSESEKEKLNKFNFELFGDVLPDNVPRNIINALEFMKEVPTLIKKANDGKGKAMKYTLLPIEVLRTSFGKESKLNGLVNNVNKATVKKCVKLFDDMNAIQQKFNDLVADLKQYEPYVPTEQVNTIYRIHSEYDILQSEVQRDLSKMLIDVRSSKQDVLKLEDIMTNYRNKLEDSKQNKTSRYNEIRPALKFVKFFEKQNVTLLKKTTLFRQFLREHFGEDIYILFYNMDQSDENEEVINTFQKMLRNRDDYGKALFVAVSYDLLNESKYPIEIDPKNSTKINFYKNNAILIDNFKPGAKRPIETHPENWSLYQIQQVLNITRNNLKDLTAKHEELTTKTVPIGFVYVQYPFTEDPDKMWPNCKWERISNQFKGAFFRAEGRSESFGTQQFENSPRLSAVAVEVSGQEATAPYGDNHREIIPGKWSKPQLVSEPYTQKKRSRMLKFFVRDAEVRPHNYAVRIWKRIA